MSRRRPSLTLALAGAAATLVAAAPAAEHKAEVERAIFELCPKLLDGSLSLGDAAKAEAIGYTLTAPRDTPAGKNPRAVRGAGTERIVISITNDPSKGVCAVWFGGPDNSGLFKGVVKRARKSGYKGGSAGRLGDGTEMYNFKLAGAQPRSLVLMAGDGGGELDFDPATTAIMMTDKGN